MATCAVYGNMLTPDGAAVTSVTVAARIPNPVLVGSSLITPAEISTATDASGNFTLTLQQSLQVIFTVTYPIVGTEPMRQFSMSASVPAQASVDFASIVTLEV